MEEQDIQYIPLTLDNFKEYIPYEGIDIGDTITKLILEEKAYIRIDLKNKAIFLIDEKENYNLISSIKVNGKPMTILLDYFRSVFYDNKFYIPRLCKKLIESIDMDHMEDIIIKNRHTGLNFSSKIVKDVEVKTLFEEIELVLKFSIEEIKLDNDRIKYYSQMYKDLILFGTLTMRTISARRNKDTQKKVVNMIIDYLIENIDTKSLLLINEEEPNIIKTKLILLEGKYQNDKDLIDNYFNHHENLCNLLLHYNTLDKIINGNLKTAFISTLGFNHIENTNMILKDYVNLAYNAKLIDINMSQNEIQINKEELKVADLIKLMLLSISGYISLKYFSIIDFQINLPSEKLKSLFYIGKIKNYNEDFQLRVNLIKDKYTLPYEDVLGKEEALFFNYFLFLENNILLSEEFNQLKRINESNYIKYEECKLKIQLENF